MGQIFNTIGFLTVLSFGLCPVFFSPTANAELRAFRLRITDTATGTDRTVISRLDDLQYRQYFAVKTSETIRIEQTWMCYRRGDFTGTLCPAPESTGPVSGDQDRSPAGSPANADSHR
ncbi:MAG: hypothetical protein J0L82_15515 [Deltaproteobacteria bacterium]|nr:hypothetical protein [Deltaproteobacteria bacterium]